MPAAILFLGLIFTIFVAVHILMVSLARTTVQAAANYAVSAAQAAVPGEDPCNANPPPQCCFVKPTSPQPGDPYENRELPESTHECEGEYAARLSMLGAPIAVGELRPPTVLVQKDRGVVTGVVFGVVISPIFGAMEITGRACGPLDTVSEHELTNSNAWEC